MKINTNALTVFEKIINKFFNISAHEWPRVALSFFLKLFFQIAFIAGTTMLTALFVEHYEVKNLPVLYLIQSILIIIGTIMFSGSLSKTVMSKIIAFGSNIATLILFISPFLYVSGHAEHGGNLLFFAAILLSIFLFLIQVNIWLSLFIESLFSPLESERAFPIIESSEPIGGILGGVFVFFLSDYFQDDIENIFYFIALILLIVPIIMATSSNIVYKFPHLVFEKKENTGESKKDVIKRTYSFFRHSPFFTGIFILVFLQFFTAYFLEFQYTSEVAMHAQEASVNNSGHSDSGHGASSVIAHSLGMLHIAIHGALFFGQILFASRFMRKFGIIKTFALSPILYFCAFVSMLFTPSFYTSVLSKGTFDVGNGVSKNAFASIFYAMREHIRDEAKGFLEGIARPLGSFFGTSFLLLFQFIVPENYLSISISLVITAIAFFSIIFSLRLQNHYTLLSRKSLESRKSLDEKMNAIEILSQPGHKNATDFLTRVLSYRHEIPEIKAKVLNVIGKMQDTSSIPAVLKCLQEDDKVVKLAAVRALAQFKNLGDHFFTQAFSKFRVQEELKKLIQHTRSQEIKTEAMRVFANIRDASIISYIIKMLESKDKEIVAKAITVCSLFHDSSSISYLEPFLNDANPRIRASAIVALWQFVPLRLSLILNMATMLESKDIDILLAGIHAVGETKSSQERSRLLALLKHEEEAVRQHAAVALAKINETESVSHLLEFLFHENKEIGQQTKKMLRNAHEDILKILHKRSVHHISKHLLAVIEKQKGEVILEDLPKKTLTQFMHFYELIGADREFWKVRVILEKK